MRIILAICFALLFAVGSALAGGHKGAAKRAWKEGRAAMKAGNHAIAAQELGKAAELGHHRAQFRLGRMYEKGIGVGQSYEMARKWYTLSAEQDNASAQERLGNLLRKGHGGPADLVEAYKWYTLSTERRPDDDKEHFRGWIEKRLTYDELAEAKKRAKEWREKN